MLASKSEIPRSDYKTWPIKFSFVTVGSTTQQAAQSKEFLVNLIQAGSLRADYFVFDEKSDDIYCKYSLREWEALVEANQNLRNYFPYAENLLSPSSTVYLNRYNIEPNNYQGAQKTLLEAAKISQRPVDSNRSKISAQTVGEFIPQALDHSNGICIGNYHDQEAAYRAMTDKLLPCLEKQGVKFLFIEHFHHSSQQIMLDEFMDTGVIPPDLQAYISYLETHYHLNQPLIKELLHECRNRGIKPIAIETNETYAEDMGSLTSNQRGNNRLLMMNYLLKNAIDKYASNTKWAAFIGADHLHSDHDILGACELTGAYSVLLEQMDEGEELDDVAIALRSKVDYFQKLQSSENLSQLNTRPHFDSFSIMNETSQDKLSSLSNIKSSAQLVDNFSSIYKKHFIDDDVKINDLSGDINNQNVLPPSKPFSCNQKIFNHFDTLWNKLGNHSTQEKILSLLNDYTENNHLALRIVHGHWNRHYVKEVNDIVQASHDKNYETIIAELKNIPIYTPDGTLANLIYFLDEKLAKPQQDNSQEDIVNMGKFSR